MNKRQVLMRPISYSFGLLAGSLCLILFTVPSFGSDHFNQEDTYEIAQTSANTLQTAVLLSPEYSLPHDIRVHILSFLSKQDDLLRIGTASKSWRKAAGKMWEKRWLDLSNKPLTEADYKALASDIFPRLRLNNVNLDDKGAMILTKCSHLQALEVNRNKLHMTPALGTLLSLPSLRQITLDESHIDDEDAKGLTEVLKGSMAVTLLSLAYNRIGNEGVTTFALSLNTLTTLTKLDLAINKIGERGAIAIAGALVKNTSLTTVDLSTNYICPEGATAIARALAQNTILTTVGLSGNRIGPKGATAIAAALKVNKTLTKLYLGGNEIGNDGAQAIAVPFQENTTLTTVYLDHNTIGNEGAKVIAAALQENKTLTSINLYGNEIGDEGAEALTEAVRKNTTLTTVNLWSNRIGDKGKKTLEDLKRSRPSLILDY